MPFFTMARGHEHLYPALLRGTPEHVQGLRRFPYLRTGLQCVINHLKIHTMRTNIVIDDELMDSTLRATGLKTKREAVELGLRTLLRLRQQQEIKRFRGKLDWQGDLDAMRSDK